MPIKTPDANDNARTFAGRRNRNLPIIDHLVEVHLQRRKLARSLDEDKAFCPFPSFWRTRPGAYGVGGLYVERVRALAPHNLIDGANFNNRTSGSPPSTSTCDFWIFPLFPVSPRPQPPAPAQ